MSDPYRLPTLVRAGFLWNKYGFSGRGYLPRLIGRRFVREGDYAVRTKHGANLLVDLHNLDIYATIFNSGGEWDPHIVQTCHRLLRTSDVFFDIGANAGCVSLDIRALIGEDVRMCLFEPQPSLSSSIRKSIAFNRFNNIEVFEILLGDYDGTGELYLTSHAVHASMIPRENAFEKITLPISRVDTLVATGRCPPPDIIKMDTEGAELRILNGMRQTLVKYSPTIVLEADSNMSRFGYSASDLITLISSVGNYDFYGTPGWDILAVARRHRDRNHGWGRLCENAPGD